MAPVFFPGLADEQSWRLARDKGSVGFQVGDLDAHRVKDDQVGRYDRHENKLHRGGPCLPGYLPFLPGPDQDEVSDRPVRFGGIRLNPKDDILDPEFFQGDPGREQGDFLVAGGEGRVGQIGAEKTEAARPVFLGRRPPSAEVVMEKAVEEILGGRVAGIGLGLDRLIGEGFGPADFIHPNDNRPGRLDRREPHHGDGDE